MNRLVFTGDTIFTGGTGRFFEGGPQDMAAAMAVARDQLPGNTKMYNGHEYTVQNMKFANLVDPQNQAIQSLTQVAAQ